MFEKTITGAAILGTALVFTPTAAADPDPHIPNGEAGWCPGGEQGSYGGARYCLGTPFSTGAFYAQLWSLGPSGPFGPGAWRSGISCSAMINGSVQGATPSMGVPDCDGGPRTIN